ncbi:Crp/Fnr family transcriptional regulator [Saccharopolyspora shandongensis]|uniref:Crp/Fnr family transcriptional regulator n=1 Tax=Saccharopolyspora shandongensis TaxID=418495 RepID=UPI0034347B9C
MQDDSRERGRLALRSAGRSASFRRGDRLIVAGSASVEVLLVEEGLVKAVLSDRDGAEPVVGLFGAGDLLGEIGVVGHRPRSAHIVALTSGIVVRVPGDVFRLMQQRDDDVRALLDESWWQRQRNADARQLSQTRDVRTRVATTLLSWARAFGRPTESGLLMRGVSQLDIAQAVCASDKTVDAVLASFRASGLLRTGRLWYQVLDPQAMESLAVLTESQTDQ